LNLRRQPIVAVMPNYRRAFVPGGCWFFTVCYINPVKHGLVTRVRDWPHSSFHRDVRAELFPEDWAGDVSAEGDFGER
jgi:hypothetical protein